MLVRYLPILILATIWEGVTRFWAVPDYLLPSLSSIFGAFIELAADDLWFHLSRSISRGGIALGSAIVIGITLGVLMAQIRSVRILFKPFVQLFYPMPKSALIPIAIVWFGLGDVSKVVLIFIGSLLPIVVSSFNSARGVDEVLVWSARGLGANNREVLWEVILPAALPEILAGVRVALAISFILMVSAELIIGNDGIGFVISSLGETGYYQGMWVGIIVISAVGFFADRLYVLGMRRILVWQESGA